MSSSVTSINIANIAYNVEWDNSSTAVMNAWATYISPLNTIYNLVAQVDANQISPPPAANITSDDATSAANALISLLTLANQGLTDPTTGGADYLNINMGQSLSTIISTMNQAGIYVVPEGSTYVVQVQQLDSDSGTGQVPPIYTITANSTPTSAALGVLTNNLQQWLDIAQSSTVVQNALTIATQEATTGNKSLQNLVELNYVASGNEALTNSLGSLQTQMNTTNGILQTLSGLQSVLNDTAVQGKNAFSTYFNFLTANPLGVLPDGSAIGITTFQTIYEFFSTSGPYLPSSYVDRFQYVSIGAQGSAVFVQSAYLNKTPLHGIGSARILAYDHISGVTVVNTKTHVTSILPEQIEFITVSRVFSKLSASLQMLYASHQNALIEYHLSAMPGKTLRPDATGSNLSTWQAIYTHLASAYYGQPVVPVLPSSLVYNVSAFMAAKDQLVTLRDQLLSEISVVMGLTSPGAQNLPDTLLGQLKTVYKDLNSVFVDNQGNPITSATSFLDSFNGFQTYIIDKNNLFNSASGVNAGLYESHVTQAISGAQTQNSAQQEQVRQAIYIFEEFYESAADVLQSLTQIIQNMAQNISM